jgi:hypothetical protein
MRLALAIVLVLGAAALVGAQPPKDAPGKAPPVPADPVPRYAVNPRVKAYPQDTPKAALRSAVAAIDNAEYTYLVAHLLDPRFVDAAVTERAKQFEAGAEDELARLREAQRANLNRIEPEDRVPLDEAGFLAMANARARARGFKQLVKDIEQKLSDDPQTVKEFRRVLRDGTFAEGEPTASATHPDLKGRTLYFRKVGARWYLENRQAEEKKEP